MKRELSPHYYGQGPYYRLEHIRTLGVSGWWVVDYDGMPVTTEMHLEGAKKLMEELEKEVQDLYRSQME